MYYYNIDGVPHGETHELDFDATIRSIRRVYPTQRITLFDHHPSVKIRGVIYEASAISPQVKAGSGLTGLLKESHKFQFAYVILIDGISVMDGTIGADSIQDAIYRLRWLNPCGTIELYGGPAGDRKFLASVKEFCNNDPPAVTPEDWRFVSEVKRTALAPTPSDKPTYTLMPNWRSTLQTICTVSILSLNWPTVFQWVVHGWVDPAFNVSAWASLLPFSVLACLWLFHPKR